MDYRSIQAVFIIQLPTIKTVFVVQFYCCFRIRTYKQPLSYNFTTIFKIWTYHYKIRTAETALMLLQLNPALPKQPLFYNFTTIFKIWAYHYKIWTVETALMLLQLNSALPKQPLFYNFTTIFKIWTVETALMLLQLNSALPKQPLS